MAFVLKVSLLGLASLILLAVGGISSAAGHSVVVEDMIATERISAEAVIFPGLTNLLSAPVLASGLLIARKVFRMTRERMPDESHALR